MTTIPLALTQIKSIVQGISSPTINAVYEYPADYASVNVSSLPIALVSHAVTLESSIQKWSLKQKSRIWYAEVAFLHARMPQPETMGETLARIETGQEAYAPALTAVLAADTRLGGTAIDITDDSSNEFLRVIHTPYTWQLENYYAVVCVFPVKQLA